MLSLEVYIKSRFARASVFRQKGEKPGTACHCRLVQNQGVLKPPLHVETFS